MLDEYPLDNQLISLVILDILTKEMQIEAKSIADTDVDAAETDEQLLRDAVVLPGFRVVAEQLDDGVRDVGVAAGHRLDRLQGCRRWSGSFHGDQPILRPPVAGGSRPKWISRREGSATARARPVVGRPPPEPQSRPRQRNLEAG